VVYLAIILIIVAMPPDCTLLSTGTKPQASDTPHAIITAGETEVQKIRKHSHMAREQQNCSKPGFPFPS
jgi:hypothetical protein